jgi:predicted dehydrogenase
MIKLGIVGVGHLGKIHLKLAKTIHNTKVIGFFDINTATSKNIEQEFNIQSFNNIDTLFEQCDAIIIATPTIAHYSIAEKAIRAGKHLFIEKPVTYTIEEGRRLIELAHEAQVIVQVGHVERFNPAFLAAKPYIKNSLFIENHRLAEFNPRGTDVSVIMDLMIHDIDIILSIIQSDIKSISANGVAVVSDTPDIANARIEFVNGCVANLTASRISLKNMRKTRFFQQDAYISVDFLEKKCEIMSLKTVDNTDNPLGIYIDSGEFKKQISYINPTIPNTNAIQEELKSLFHQLNKILNLSLV